METAAQYQPGQRIQHAEFGEGVIVGPPQNGYIRAFFPVGECQIPVETLRAAQSWTGRIQEAPPWDLVVFDEAHHLNAYRSGRKVKKTENFKLAEALKDHSRDLLLLSATPHQGDHFRFWMLVLYDHIVINGLAFVRLSVSAIVSRMSR